MRSGCWQSVQTRPARGAVDEMVPTSLDGQERGQRRRPGSRAHVPLRNRSPTPRDPGRINVWTLSGRTNARNPVSHAGDGHVGRLPRRPNAWREHGDPKPPACKPHQSSLSHPGRQHRFSSGVRLDLPHGEVVAQAHPGIDFPPDVRSAHADAPASQRNGCP